MIVLGCGDEMAATLGAGVVEPGDVCDVMGTAEPVCAVTDVPLHDVSGVVELHPHADPESWLLENPGWLSGAPTAGSATTSARARSSAPSAPARTSTSC